jgi:arylsulfatase A-like enzyme
MTLIRRAGLAVLVVVGLFAVRPMTASQAANHSPPYLVLIVMDGFRPDYFSQAPMHHIHMLMRSGMTYTRAYVGQLETETPTGHATVATGAYPRTHGVMGFVWKDPTGQNISWMPTNLQLLNAGDMEQLIESGGTPTLSDVLHKSYPNALSVSLSGEKYYAADAMGPGANYIVYGDSLGSNQGSIVATAIGKHLPPARAGLKSLTIHAGADPLTEDTWAGDLALQLVQKLHPHMLLVNLPGPDIEGHRSGGVTAPVAIKNVDVGVDAVLAKLIAAYKKAGIYKRTTFVITADHGMIPNGHIINKKEMYAGARATGVPLLEEDFLGTAGYIFLRNPSDSRKVAADMVAHHYKWVEGALYKVRAKTGWAFKADPTTAKSLGPSLTRAYIHLADTFASPSSPDVVLPFYEDTIGLITKIYGAHWGTHGGLSWRVQHIPLIISGPGVRHGTSSFPAQLVDVAPTAEHLMGLPVPKSVDGVVLANALKHAPASEKRVQRSVASSRSADVDALRQHSIAQHGMVLSNQYG